MIRQALLPTTLAVGDLVALLLALPVALFLRAFTVPSLYLMSLHVIPFSLLACLSLAIFFSAGLYDAPTALIRKELPGTIFAAQVINILIAGLVFFFIPIFKITPKATLILYLGVSVVFIALWRFAALSLSKLKEESVAVLGDGTDVADLLGEFSAKGLLPFRAVPVSVKEYEAEALRTRLHEVLSKNPAFVIADLDDPRLKPILHEIDAYRRGEGRVVDFSDFYERLFHRVPLSALSYRSFLVDRGPLSLLYDVLKRAVDIILSVPLALLLILLWPFVFLAVRLEGKGPLLISQERIGKDWRPMTVMKFRTMTQNKSASGEWTVEEKKDNKVTKVGAFLRRTSIDELPQILSVISGKLSLVGPRSDIVGLGTRLEESIPSYRLRYAVTPGISGWAQVNQRYAPGNISPQSIEESQIRLAYDLYYVKHRSPLLDISITLRTIKTLLSRLFV